MIERKGGRGRERCYRSHPAGRDKGRTPCATCSANWGTRMSSPSLTATASSAAPDRTSSASRRGAWLAVGGPGLLVTSSLPAQELKLRATLKEHTVSLQSVAFSPDSKT